MTLKQKLIVLAVQILAERTTIVRKPDPAESLINAFIGVEDDDRRLARQIEETLDQVTDTVKRAKVKREFKKITRNV